MKKSASNAKSISSSKMADYCHEKSWLGYGSHLQHIFFILLVVSMLWNIFLVRQMVTQSNTYESEISNLVNKMVGMQKDAKEMEAKAKESMEMDKNPQREYTTYSDEYISFMYPAKGAVEVDSGVIDFVRCNDFMDNDETDHCRSENAREGVTLIEIFNEEGETNLRIEDYLGREDSFIGSGGSLMVKNDNLAEIGRQFAGDGYEEIATSKTEPLVYKNTDLNLTFLAYDTPLYNFSSTSPANKSVFIGETRPTTVTSFLGHLHHVNKDNIDTETINFLGGKGTNVLAPSTNAPLLAEVSSECVNMDMEEAKACLEVIEKFFSTVKPTEKLTSLIESEI